VVVRAPAAVHGAIRSAEIDLHDAGSVALFEFVDAPAIECDVTLAPSETSSANDAGGA